jgi:hypothetical protein
MDDPDERRDDVRREELERLARSRPKSGRGQLAKASALRELGRLERPLRNRPPPPCPPKWHPQPGSVMEELDSTDPHFGPTARRRLFEEMWENGELDESGHCTPPVD